jgi:putative transposase
MPWQEHSTMKLREEFVLQAMEPGAVHADVCRQHGISPKTGYKWRARFEAGGRNALADMSRRPHRPISTPGEVVVRLVELRRAFPKWGPKKLRLLLQGALPDETIPSVKTLQRILARMGEPRLRRARRPNVAVERAAPQTKSVAPCELWTVDFKGWWLSGDGARCEPLTVRDAFSRFILALTLMRSTRTPAVQDVFERLFMQFGVPRRIQVDNGSPFGSTVSFRGLSKLSAWWVAIGIEVVFSRPGKPQDNGAHERMHADISRELQSTPAATIEAQQRLCEKWVHQFNYVRPHEALQMQTPAKIFRHSRHRWRGPREPRYATGMQTRKVTTNGVIKYAQTPLFVGHAFAGHVVGVEPIEARGFRIWFHDLELGTIAPCATPARAKGAIRGDSKRHRCKPLRR